VTSQFNTQFNSVESERGTHGARDKGKHLGFNTFNTDRLTPARSLFFSIRSVFSTSLRPSAHRATVSFGGAIRSPAGDLASTHGQMSKRQGPVWPFWPLRGDFRGFLSLGCWR
jgi:hypothetical protein